MAGTAGRSGRRPKPTARKALAGKPEKMQSRLSKLSMLPIHCHLCSQWRYNNQYHSNNHSKVDLCLILVKPRKKQVADWCRLA